MGHTYPSNVSTLYSLSAATLVWRLLRPTARSRWRARRSGLSSCSNRRSSGASARAESACRSACRPAAVRKAERSRARPPWVRGVSSLRTAYGAVASYLPHHGSGRVRTLVGYPRPKAPAPPARLRLCVR